MKSFFVAAALFCFALVSTTSCFDGDRVGGMLEDLKEGLNDALVLRDTLKKTYDVVEVNVNFMNDVVVVSFINSPLMKLDEDGRDSVAKDVGRLTRSIFGPSKVRSGVLMFNLVGDVEIDEDRMGMNSYPLFDDEHTVVGGFGTGEPDGGNTFGDSLYDGPTLTLDSVGGDSLGQP